MKEFLNDEEDYEAYLEYEKRLPERQQIDGLRAAMAAAESPLSTEQESAVIEAMYQVRTQTPDTTDWNGPEAMDILSGGGAVERFESEWDRTAGATAEAVGDVLDEKQMDAFREYQDQVKEMQLMGIKMAAKMFEQQEEPASGE